MKNKEIKIKKGDLVCITFPHEYPIMRDLYVDDEELVGSTIKEFEEKTGAIVLRLYKKEYVTPLKYIIQKVREDK